MEPPNPLFSVVLTTRDRPAMLRDAIASVEAQTIDDWELVVVDDGSEPPAVVPDDARIRLIRNDEARGTPAGARNVGVSVARGRVLAFLDDDDLWAPRRLEVVVPALERAPVVVCATGVLGAPPGRPRVLEGCVGDTILDDFTPPIGSVTVARSAWIPMDERWRQVEDVEWWLRIAQVAVVTSVAEVGYLVAPRTRDDHGRWRRRADENVALVEAHVEYFGGHRRAAAFRLKRAGLIYLQAGERARARRVLLRALRIRPTLNTLGHLVRSVRPGGRAR